MRKFICVAIFFTLAGSAAAAELGGVWLRENGQSRVRVASCADSMCGVIVWLKDSSGPSKSASASSTT